MPIKFVSRAPRRSLDFGLVDQRLRQWLRDVGREVRDEMKVYPPIRPWRHGFPTSGPRRNGRRTGAYKRGWKLRVTPKQFTLTNEVSYSQYVGGSRRARPGRRQAGHMAERGWPSISDVSDKIRRKHLARLRRLVVPPAR